MKNKKDTFTTEFKELVVIKFYQFYSVNKTVKYLQDHSYEANITREKVISILRKMKVSFSSASKPKEKINTSAKKIKESLYSRKCREKYIKNDKKYIKYIASNKIKHTQAFRDLAIETYRKLGTIKKVISYLIQNNIINYVSYHIMLEIIQPMRWNLYNGDPKYYTIKYSEKKKIFEKEKADAEVEKLKPKDIINEETENIKINKRIYSSQFIKTVVLEYHKCNSLFKTAQYLRKHTEETYISKKAVLNILYKMKIITYSEKQKTINSFKEVYYQSFKELVLEKYLKFKSVSKVATYLMENGTVDYIAPEEISEILYQVKCNSFIKKSYIIKSKNKKRDEKEELIKKELIEIKAKEAEWVKSADIELSRIEEVYKHQYETKSKIPALWEERHSGLGYLSNLDYEDNE